MKPEEQVYAVVAGGEAYDWNDYLTRAIAGETSSLEDIHAINRSCSWVTCACGNQCSIIPRDEDGEPLDKTLSALGIDFYEKVRRYKYKEAQGILKQIEKRSTKLIRAHYEKIAKAEERKAIAFLKSRGWTFQQ